MPTLEKNTLDSQPSNLEEIVKKIIKTHSKNAVFAYYTIDDASQEIWIICLDGLKRYDPSKGKLEHFLNRHVSNRLKNLKRDKYYHPDNDLTHNSNSRRRMNLVNALPIHIIKNLTKSKMLASSSSSTPMDPSQISQYTEIMNALVEKLPDEILPYFEQLISGDKIDKSILQTIREMCHVILKDMGYDTGF